MELFHLTQPKEQQWCSGLRSKEVRGSIPGLTATILEICYLLLPSRDIAEILLKQRKSSTQ